MTRIPERMFGCLSSRGSLRKVSRRRGRSRSESSKPRYRKFTKSKSAPSARRVVALKKLVQVRDRFGDRSVDLARLDRGVPPFAP